MNQKVFIADSHCTKFGTHFDRDLASLCQEGIPHADVEAIYFASALSSPLAGQNHLSSYLSEVLSFHGPIFPVEAACASGGLAIFMAAQAIRAGTYQKVLVLGAEKMSDASKEEVQKALMQAASFEERELGLSFVDVYALLAQSYQKKYGLDEKILAEISVQMHENALAQNEAHFQKSITPDEVLQSPILTTPLRRFHASPMSDGACAVVLTTKKTPFELIDSEFQTGALSVKNRLQNPGLPAVQRAAKNIYARNKINAAQIKFLELHDCFTIAFLIALEDLGLLQSGQAKNWKNLFQKINLSGGLKAFGHPISATGVRQIHSLKTQLENQPVGTLGMTHNVGGSGGTAILHLIRKDT